MRSQLPLTRRLALAWGHAAACLLPARCFVCGNALPAASHLGACASCWAALVPVVHPLCRTCGVSLPEAARAVAPAESHCARCVLRPLPLDAVLAVFVYDDTARQFLLRAKLAGRRELCPAFGRQLAVAVRVAGFAAETDAVVGVPSSPLTRLRRGFDPAHAIGREVARAIGRPLEPGRLRRRAIAFRPAKGLSAVDRWKSLREAFVARRGEARRILLVDDVMTSGATATACAIALRGCGATQVKLVVWARTPRRGGFDRAPPRLL